MTSRRRLVRVPASSANLGPGYDAMAAAVSLHLELEVAETGEYSFDPGGLDVPTGRENLIVRAFESLRPADGIAFRTASITSGGECVSVAPKWKRTGQRGGLSRYEPSRVP